MFRETIELDVGTRRVRSVDFRSKGEWVAVLQEGAFLEYQTRQREAAFATSQPPHRSFWSVFRSLFSAPQAAPPASVAATNEEVQRDVTTIVLCGGAEFAILQPIAFPLIRFLGDDRVLVVDRRCPINETNAWIFAYNGDMLEEFSVGDAVQDIWTTHNKIVVTHFDEASGDPWETGVVVFDATGNFEFAFDSVLGDASTIETGGSCLTEEGDLWFLPYTTHDDIFVQLNINDRKVTMHPMPEEIGDAPLAIATVDGAEFFVQIPDTDREERRTKIMSFRHGQPPRLVDYAGRRELGSLSNGKFITWNDQSFTIIDPAIPQSIATLDS